MAGEPNKDAKATKAPATKKKLAAKPKKVSATSAKSPAKRAAKPVPAAEMDSTPKPVAKKAVPKKAAPKAAPKVPEAPPVAAKPAAKAAPKPKAAKPVPVTISREDIALRAYYIAERRQSLGWPGDESSDWIEAERQLLAEAKRRPLS